MILYGIRTCDSCKKALKALEAANHPVSFRDVRADPLTLAERSRFIDAFGDQIVNRSSTTWRGLSDWLKASEVDAQLAAHPTLMKRPVIDTGDALLLGWGPDVQAAVLK
jgi:arsenate reductase-like glutaredoxin family protein